MKVFNLFILLGLLLVLTVSCGNKAQSWYDEGWDLARKGDLEDAVVCYDKALELDPEFVDAWYNKGLALMKLSNWGEAVKCFDKVIEYAPDNEAAWINKGQALFNRGEYKEAIVCYDKAIELKPDYELAKTYKEQAINLKDTQVNNSGGGGGGGVNPFDTTNILNKAQNSVDMVDEFQSQ